MKILICVLTLGLGSLVWADEGKVDWYSPSAHYGEITSFSESRPLSVVEGDFEPGLDYLVAGECVSFDLSLDKAQAIHVRKIACP